MRYQNGFAKKRSIVVFSVLLLIALFATQQHAVANGSVQPLVNTQWLADNLNNKSVRIVHVGGMAENSQQMFAQWHIPGSVYLGIGEIMGALGNGSTPPDKSKAEAMMGRLGIDVNTHAVIVGSSDNPFTASALWLLKYNGHNSTSFLDGGIKKWMSEKRPMTGEPTTVTSSSLAANPDKSILTSADYVLKNLKNPEVKIVDARTPGEYIGKDNPAKHKRTGHVPGAVNMEFYSTNLKKDGTFKSINDLKAVYEVKGITKDKEVIVYCDAGIRASHTHFVLKYLLGYPKVKNYVGSWGEWGNRVDFSEFPAEK